MFLIAGNLRVFLDNLWYKSKKHENTSLSWHVLYFASNSQYYCLHVVLPVASIITLFFFWGVLKNDKDILYSFLYYKLAYTKLKFSTMSFLKSTPSTKNQPNISMHVLLPALVEFHTVEFHTVEFYCLHGILLHGLLLRTFAWSIACMFLHWYFVEGCPKMTRTISTFFYTVNT